MQVDLSTSILPNGEYSSSGIQNIQASTGQYATHAGEPAQPVQFSLMIAICFGLRLRKSVRPRESGSIFWIRFVSATVDME